MRIWSTVVMIVDPPGEPTTSAIAATPPIAVSSPAVRATTATVAGTAPSSASAGTATASVCGNVVGQDVITATVRSAEL